LWGPVAFDLVGRTLSASGAEAKLDALEQVLAARLRHVPNQPHPLAAYAATQIARNPERWGLAALDESLGLSPRRLQQVFRTEVGLTPKAYQRLHRFRRALVGINRAAEVGWAVFALERGYYDRSHFIGEFRIHAGLTPSEYVASRGDELNHVSIAA
jgi:methylphosphotriester-DNA--protein-cysteine methyltransferase